MATTPVSVKHLSSRTNSGLALYHSDPRTRASTCLESAAAATISSSTLHLFNNPSLSCASRTPKAQIIRIHASCSSSMRPMRWWSLSDIRSKSQVSACSKEEQSSSFSSENKFSNGLQQTGSEDLVSSIGVSEVPLRALYLNDQQLLLVGFTACGILGVLSCFFLAAIPTLLSMKKAADSFEKLADATREELPRTMAAVRLSGMEISDLTMELSDLGQEITSGIRSSARAVRAAEDGLRRMGGYTTSGSEDTSKGDDETSSSPCSKQNP